MRCPARRCERLWKGNSVMSPVSGCPTGIIADFQPDWEGPRRSAALRPCLPARQVPGADSKGRPSMIGAVQDLVGEAGVVGEGLCRQQRAHGVQRAQEALAFQDGEDVGVAEAAGVAGQHHGVADVEVVRSEEHTSELQSLMRSSYAVFCSKKKTKP